MGNSGGARPDERASGACVLQPLRAARAAPAIQQAARAWHSAIQQAAPDTSGRTRMVI